MFYIAPKYTTNLLVDLLQSSRTHYSRASHLSARDSLTGAVCRSEIAVFGGQFQVCKSCVSIYLKLTDV